MMEAQRSSEEKSLKEEKWFGAADEQYEKFWNRWKRWGWSTARWRRRSSERDTS